VIAEEARSIAASKSKRREARQYSPLAFRIGGDGCQSISKPKMVADARGEGRAPPPVAPPAPAPDNGVDAAAGEAASKPPR
jgi:hypothetical protein